MPYSSLSEIDANRTLFLFDQFDQQTSEGLISGLLRLDAENHEDINIIINSYGGEVYSLFSILDTITSIKSDVNTFCLGEADSCGAVLLSAGKERYIGENSRAMIHEVSSVVWGKVNEMEESMVEARKVNDRLIGILAENMRQEEVMLREVMKKDTFLDSQTAYEMRLVDFILDDAALQYAKENASSFKNEFSGRARDAVSANLFYASVVDPLRPKQDPVKEYKELKNAVKKSLKGEEPMKKEELLNVLKTEHSIDVTTLQNSLEKSEKSLLKTKDELKNALDESVKAKKDLADFKKQQEEDSINAILDQLIVDKKSTQALNESIYKAAFTAMGVEKAKEAAEALPVIVKDEKESVDGVDSDLDLTAKEIEHKAITALAAEKGLTYTAAADIYYKEKDVKEGEDE